MSEAVAEWLNVKWELNSLSMQERLKYGLELGQLDQLNHFRRFESCPSRQFNKGEKS